MALLIELYSRFLPLPGAGDGEESGVVVAGGALCGGVAAGVAGGLPLAGDLPLAGGLPLTGGFPLVGGLPLAGGLSLAGAALLTERRTTSDAAGAARDVHQLSTISNRSRRVPRLLYEDLRQRNRVLILLKSLG